MFIIISIILGTILLALGLFLRDNNDNIEKISTYECGFETFEDAKMKFNIRYYLIAIIFILFDLEIAFIFPWAISFDQSGLIGFNTIMIFLLILTIGFIYEWKKGALNWN